MRAAANSEARREAGRGAMAMPRRARVVMMRTSAREERTSQGVGRSPQRWWRARMA